MHKLRYILETNMFGVCTKIGTKLNFSPSSIRLYFIYASFFTFGSPVLIYLIMAFWMEVRSIIRKSETPSVWEI